MYIKEALTYYNKLHGKKVTMQQAANEIAAIYNGAVEKGVIDGKPVKGNTLHNYISQHLSKNEKSKDFLKNDIVYCMEKYFYVNDKFINELRTHVQVHKVLICLSELNEQEEELVIWAHNNTNIEKSVELTNDIKKVQEQIKRMQELKEWLIEIGKN